MPGQARQSPSVAPQAPSVGTAHTSASGRGNAAAQEQMGPVADALPEEIDLQSAGLSFVLPGPVNLTDDWNQLGTTAPTRKWVDVSRRELRVSFSPALLLDAQWPLSNVAISGFTWDFVTGRMKKVDVADTQFAIPSSRWARWPTSAPARAWCGCSASSRRSTGRIRGWRATGTSPHAW